MNYSDEKKVKNMSDTKKRNEVRTVSEISTGALKKVKEIMKFSDFFR